ncbi:hypothetical protein IEQ34_005654 [Dendrobium chrysotoxum]|uniref:Uncharacterized protein n=1 Tax=Dendrobium chrysotoxum TaxID=161865 RepID=A0AAV7H9H9_DENCH|nr:hypothetical protein IEQ34_005654 [Dendrobium chrysotoxum]
MAWRVQFWLLTGCCAFVLFQRLCFFVFGTMEFEKVSHENLGLKITKKRNCILKLSFCKLRMHIGVSKNKYQLSHVKLNMIRKTIYTAVAEVEYSDVKVVTGNPPRVTESIVGEVDAILYASRVFPCTD